MMSNEAALTVLPELEEPSCCSRTGQSKSVSQEQAKEHQHDHQHHKTAHTPVSLNRTAFMATVHCLTGCTIGEVLGMVIGTALGWTTWPTVALAVVLAFVFGYAMTLWPLRRAGMAWSTAVGLAFASDTLSMTTMEIVDNFFMLVIPGAMDAGLTDGLFWGSLGISLVLAGAAAFPVNRWLIARGQGHALVHAHHGC